MARYKHIDTNPKFLPVDLARQLRPGTFEYALNYLLDREIESPRLPWRPVGLSQASTEAGAIHD